LPKFFFDYLFNENDPHALAYFTERRLRPVAQMEDEVEQAKILEEMIQEAREKARPEGLILKLTQVNTDPAQFS